MRNVLRLRHYQFITAVIILESLRVIHTQLINVYYGIHYYELDTTWFSTQVN